MGKSIRKITVILFAVILAVSLLQFTALETQAASKTPEISAKKVTLYIGQTKKLSVKNNKSKVTWSSSNKKKAVVSKKGVVTAKKAGKVKITAKAGKKKYVCTVTVKKPYLNKTKAELTAGDKLKLKVTKTGKKITWSSSNKKTAAVSKKGVVTAKSAGKATITAKYGTVKLKCKVTVKEKDPVEEKEPDPAELTDETVILSQNEISQFENSVLDIKSTESQEEYGETKNFEITVDPSSEFAKRITNLEIKEGDVMIIPPDDIYLTGFTFKIESVSQTDDSCVIYAVQPELTDLFTGDGQIDYSAGVNSKDPLAFLITADGSTYTGEELKSGLSGTVLGASHEENGSLAFLSDDDTYLTNLFPEGVQIVPSVSVASDGTCSLGLDLDDIILYDEDKSRATQDDRILADIEFDLENIKFDGRTSWEGGLPDQIAFGMSYDTSEKMTLKLKKKFKLSDVMKKITSFDNTAKLPFGEITGVSTDGKIFLASVGIRGGRPFVAKGISGTVSVDPVFFVSVYLDLDGTISGEGSFGLTYESYKEEGFSLYDTSSKKVVNNYSFDEVKNIGTTNFKLGTWSREYASRTDKSEPQWKGAYSLDGKIDGKVAVGVMAGVSAMNIIPGDVYAEAAGSVNGSVKGTIYNLTRVTALNELFDCEGKVALDLKTSLNLGAEFGLTLRMAGKIFKNFPVGVEASVEKEFVIDDYDLEYPGAVMSGTVYDCDLDRNKAHYTAPGIYLCAFRKDKLEADGLTEYTTTDLLMRFEDNLAESGGDGSYALEKLKKGKYVLLLRTGDYHLAISEFEVVSDGDGFAKDFTKDLYVYKYNWLDELQPLKFDTANGDHGSAGMYDGSDPDKYMQISGVNYSAGIYLNNGNQGSTGTADAIWKLDGKYDSLDVRIGLLDNTSPMGAKLYVYLADTEDGLYESGIEPSQEIVLSATDVSRIHTINFHGSQYARFALQKTSWNNWATASWGFVEGVWNPAGGYPVNYNTYNFKDPFEGVNFVEDNFLNICPVFRNVSADIYNGNSDKTFKISGTDNEYSTGFVLHSHAVNEWGNGQAIFNTDGRFSQLIIDAGYTKYLRSGKFYVYLDDASEPSQTFELTKDTVSNCVINVNYAKCLRIVIDNNQDNWATDAVGFGNGTWVR